MLYMHDIPSNVYNAEHLTNDMYASIIIISPFYLSDHVVVQDTVFTSASAVTAPAPATKKPGMKLYI